MSRFQNTLSDLRSLSSGGFHFGNIFGHADYLFLGRDKIFTAKSSDFPAS